MEYLDDAERLKRRYAKDSTAHHADNVIKGKTPLYLIRHGATKLNNDTDTSVDRIRAWRDVPLADSGREEAKATGERLIGAGIEIIIASTLSRARETAEIIGKIIDVDPSFSPKLRPWDLGILTGTTTKEALPKIAAYVRNKPNEAVPEGESFNAFKARAFTGLCEAFAKANDRPLAIVTHHRVERLIKSWIAAGQSDTGTINLNVFLQKGESPGHAEIVRIDVAALNAIGKTAISPKGH